MVVPVYQTEILYKPATGVYMVTTYWSDGSITEELIPKGPIVIWRPLNL